MPEIFSPSLVSDSFTPRRHTPCAVYVHIPFCRRRCFYCDFPVSVVGDRKQGDTSRTIQQYVEVLLREISITSKFCQGLIGDGFFGDGRPLETVFFGGGTPSLLSVGQVKRILEMLDRHFGIVSGAEISMEIDPGTFSLEQLRGYVDAGINRVSLGVQAFQDEFLQVCGRSHNVADIYRAVDLIHEAGVTNFSVDLMSGLPHQSLPQWQACLQAAVAISPAHISSYDLIVEPKTPFYRYYQPGIAPLPSDEMAAQMYRMAQNILTGAGYEHYEISNYAKPGYQCRHNRVYWENKDYYGFGMGATSYVFGCRFTRPRTTVEYGNWVQRLSEDVSGFPVFNQGKLEENLVGDSEDNSENDRLLETLMLGLRLADGVNLSGLFDDFGGDTLAKVWRCLLPYYRCGWVQVLGETGVPVVGENLPINGRLRLSDPDGFLFSNTILSALFGRLG